MLHLSLCISSLLPFFLLTTHRLLSYLWFWQCLLWWCHETNSCSVFTIFCRVQIKTNIMTVQFFDKCFFMCSSSCEIEGKKKKRSQLKRSIEVGWQDMVFVLSLRGERFHYLRGLSSGCLSGGVFFPRCLSELWRCYIYFCVFSHSGNSVAPAGARQPRNQLWRMAVSVREYGGVAGVLSGDVHTSSLSPVDFFLINLFGTTSLGNHSLESPGIKTYLTFECPVSSFTLLYLPFNAVMALPCRVENGCIEYPQNSGVILWSSFSITPFFMFRHLTEALFSALYSSI